jgi:hypothetical protein
MAGTQGKSYLDDTKVPTTEIDIQLRVEAYTKFFVAKKKPANRGPCRE